VKLKFTKMQGLGNDFVVFDGVRQRVQLSSAQYREIANRHFGVGCDQILLVEKAQSKEADFRYRIFNSDGGEVEQCGNGARCFARFVRDQGLSKKTEIRVETLAGLITPRFEIDGNVTVDMGLPIFEPARIPFVAERAALIYELEVGDARIEIGALSMGNPHAVQVVPDVERAPVLKQGPLIEKHPRFPQRVNAGYMEIVDPGRIKLRVYERGAGETMACGTGACAAVVTGIRRGLLDPCVNVETRGGELTIEWRGADNSGQSAPVLMTGPAETVFEGEISV
jgi:diaminopimelate epimerase